MKKQVKILEPISRPWRITKRMANTDIQAIIDTLALISRVDGCCYYVTDFYREELHFTSPDALILCGYTQQEVKRMGLHFYNKIFPKKEWDWVLDMNRDAYRILYSYPKEERLNLVVHYDLKVIHRDGRTMLIHYELMPLYLCANGNMRMSISKVSMSPNDTSCNAYILDRKNSIRYEFANGEFSTNDRLMLKPDEQAILSMMIKDTPAADIAKLLKMSMATFNRRKKQLYEKLGASSTAGAVYRARLLGLI